MTLNISILEQAWPCLFPMRPQETFAFNRAFSNHEPPHLGGCMKSNLLAINDAMLPPIKINHWLFSLNAEETM